MSQPRPGPDLWRRDGWHRQAVLRQRQVAHGEPGGLVGGLPRRGTRALRSLLALGQRRTAPISTRAANATCSPALRRTGGWARGAALSAWTIPWASATASALSTAGTSWCGRLGAVRWPERELVFDDGEQLPLQDSGNGTTMKLKNKTIWITGASSGVGEGMATVFHREGADLIISARRRAELERVKAACTTGPGQVHVAAVGHHGCGSAGGRGARGARQISAARCAGQQRRHRPALGGEGHPARGGAPDHGSGFLRAGGTDQAGAAADDRAEERPPGRDLIGGGQARGARITAPTARRSMPCTATSTRCASSISRTTST